MKKPLAVVVGALTLVGALVGCAAPDEQGGAEHEVHSAFSQELHDALPEQVKTAGRVSVVGEPNAPWRIVASDNSVTGFAVDISKEFSEILGVEFATEMVSGLPAVKLGVQSGRNDVAFGPLLSNGATQQDMLFIDYTLGRPSFLFAADGPGMSSLLDLCGATLAHIEGSVAFDPVISSMGPKCAEAGKPPVNLLTLADTNSTILALESGRADYAGMSAHQVAYAESQNPDKFAKYVTSDEEAKPDRLGMALDGRNVQLAEAIYGAWQIVFENGTYDELMTKYNMSDITIAAPDLHLEAASS